MIPRLDIQFPIKRQIQYWCGEQYEPREGEYLLNHARTGIVMALRAALPNGGRVGVVTYNCHTVANAVVNAGCKPVFVDVTEKLTIDVESVSKDLDAIVVTNLFGVRNDIAAIRKRLPKAIIIVDNAHGYGLPVEGDFTVYSINQGKFPALGEGGILFANEDWRPNIEDLYARLPSYGLLAQVKLFFLMLVKAIAYSRCMYWLTMKMKKSSNPKIHEKVTMKKMAKGVRRLYKVWLSNAEAEVEKQRINVAKINGAFYGDNAFMAIVRTDDPKALKKEYAKRGVEAATHFQNAIVWAKQFGYKERSCPQAEKLVNKLLMIPTYTENMKNIWIDILHIPQFNFYKPFIGLLVAKGYHVYITALGRGKLPAIVRKELAEYKNVDISIIGRHRMTKISAIVEANLIRIVWLFFWCIGKKIDVAFSNGSHVGMMGRIFRFPAYEFEDDPQAADYHLMCRYATQNHSIVYEMPEGQELDKRDKVLPCLKEWAYLNPRTFVPKVEVLEKYGVSPKEYMFLREVSVGTINYAGQESGAILGIKEMIPAGMKVLFSLEEKKRRNEYPADWILLQEPIEDIHSLIYYSAGLVSSGDSMAREAALLGVPAYYLGIRYSMPANAAASKVASLQNQKTMPFEEWITSLPTNPQECAKKQDALRKHIDTEFIDINAYMLSLVKR